MVSSYKLLQAIVVIATAVAATVAPRGTKILDRVPLMPRIPSVSKHHEVLRARATMEVDHSVLAEATCLDRNQAIILHDETVAQLSICGGMPGSIDGCTGARAATVGEVGTALFTVSADDAGASITISKQQWMRCVQAARDRCPTGSLSATCVGGASSGDVSFTLENPQSHDL
ncbi:hypothetical protein AK830_g1031 [Neonectria ditissima]|uniref:Ecp2 effector protein domain-containing protein n=1 Tax=Neonectria ditissima TaxID=78410 RepID=A0A0P7BVI4_9HYPO|nr:hypothetical protein AK830_g1031 [Neonectria ditissima]